MRKIFSLLILMFISLSANANIYSYGESVVAVDSDNYKFHIVVEWDISDATANPCLVGEGGYQVRKCELRVKIQGGGFTNHGLDYLTSDCMIQVKTLGELGTCLSGADYYKTFNLTNVVLGEKSSFDYVSFNFRENSNPCVNILYRTTTNPTGSGDWTQLPNQVCGLMPPPIGSCSTPDSIEFDHETISTNFSSSELVKSFNIECNMDLNAGITLTMLDNSSRLKLGDNLYSTLMINGSNISNTNKFDLKTGSNSFEITSKLSKTGEIAGGDYNGQTVMILFID